MPEYYSPQDAARIIGASKASVRTYSIRFARYFSAEGAPSQAGTARRFTEADLRLMAFIKSRTDQNILLDDVEAALEAGELAAFAWKPPTTAQETPPGPETPHQAMLIPVERFQAAQALLEDSRSREQATAARADGLQQRIGELERALGEATGKATQLERENQRLTRAWWRKVLGME